VEIDQADLNEAMQVLLRRRKQQLDDEMEVLAEPHGYPMIAIAPKQVEGGKSKRKSLCNDSSSETELRSKSHPNALQRQPATRLCPPTPWTKTAMPSSVSIWKFENGDRNWNATSSTAVLKRSPSRRRRHRRIGHPLHCTTKLNRWHILLRCSVIDI
jgi:hypothetical protein